MLTKVVFAVLCGIAAAQVPALDFTQGAASYGMKFAGADNIFTMGSSASCTKIDGSTECITDTLNSLQTQIDDIITGVTPPAPTPVDYTSCVNQGAVLPYEFTFVGDVGYSNNQAGITHGSNKYGVLSGSHQHGGNNNEQSDGSNQPDDIFDGQFGLWSSDGGSYRAALGAPGGVEIRFASLSTIKAFKLHCIKNTNNGECYGNGQYDFGSFKLQFWTGSAWATALTSAGGGGGYVAEVYTGTEMSLNWRLYMPPNIHSAGTAGDSRPHVEEFEITEHCSTPVPLNADPVGMQCGGANPYEFTFVGDVGYSNNQVGIALGENKYGVLSGSHQHGGNNNEQSDGSNQPDDIFDGQFGLWSSDGGSYRAALGAPGGVEWRFDKPVSIRSATVHCIKNTASTAFGGCYGNGQYDFGTGNLQYWTGSAWANAVSLTDQTNGNWEIENSLAALSQNWRVYIPANSHAGGEIAGDSRAHVEEAQINKICYPVPVDGVNLDAGRTCGAVSPYEFTFVGDVGYSNNQAGITHGSNKYGVLSGSHQHGGNNNEASDGSNQPDDIFDGQFGLWGSDGGSYRAALGAPGGVELRFDQPYTIREFVLHCIKNTASTAFGGCYGNGQYDFATASLQYWTGSTWATATSITNTQTHGNWNGKYEAMATSQNWRVYIPANSHVGGEIAGDSRAHVEEFEIINACHDNVVEPTPSGTCSSIYPYAFSFLGDVGHAIDTRISTGSNVYGTLSAGSGDHQTGDIFDGQFGLWGSDGGSYRAASGAPGGVEIRFDQAYTIHKATLHCIKNTASTDFGGCYGNGQYDFGQGSFQYWSTAANRWITAVSLTDQTNGDWQIAYTGTEKSQNWRVYLPPGTHNGGEIAGDSRPHAEEFSIEQACY